MKGHEQERMIQIIPNTVPKKNDKNVLVSFPIVACCHAWPLQHCNSTEGCPVSLTVMIADSFSLSFLMLRTTCSLGGKSKKIYCFWHRINRVRNCVSNWCDVSVAAIWANLQWFESRHPGTGIFLYCSLEWVSSVVKTRLKKNSSGAGWMMSCAGWLPIVRA